MATNVLFLKMKALGLPASYEKLLTDEGVDGPVMLEATTVDELKEIGLKPAHARALKKAFAAPAPAVVQVPAPALGKVAAAPSSQRSIRPPLQRPRAATMASEDEYRPPPADQQAVRVASMAMRTMAAELTLEETALVEQMKYQLKTMQPIRAVPKNLRLNENLAVRFLMATEWSPPKAWELAQRFIRKYGSAGLLQIDPNMPLVSQQLMSGKFVAIEKNGFGFLIYRASKHKTGILMNNSAEETTATLAAGIFHLSKLTESLNVMRNGVTFLYDMTSSGIGNRDPQMSTELMALLDAFPCKMLPGYLVNAPLWVRSTQKFTEDLEYVYIAGLPAKIPQNLLPQFLGGEIVWNDDLNNRYCTALKKSCREAGLLAVPANMVKGSKGPMDVRMTPKSQRPPPPWYAGSKLSAERCATYVIAAKNNGDFLIRLDTARNVAFLMVKDQDQVATFPIQIEGNTFICGKVPHGSLDEIVVNLSRVSVKHHKTGRDVRLNQPANFGRVKPDGASSIPQLSRAATIIKPVKVTIQRKPGEKLGLKIYSDKELRGNRIMEVVPGKAASRAKGLNAGDIVVAVNGTDVVDFPHEQFMDVLKGISGTMELVVVNHRYKLPSRSQSSQPQRAPSVAPLWFAGGAPKANCVDALSTAGTGDFLIRGNKDNTKFHLMVKDTEGLASFAIVREKKQFIFGNKAHKSLDEIIANLKVAAVRGLDGKPLKLANPVKVKRLPGAAPTQQQLLLPVTATERMPSEEEVSMPPLDVSEPPPSPKERAQRKKSLPTAPGTGKKQLPVPLQPLMQEPLEQVEGGEEVAADAGGPGIAANSFVDYVNGIREAGEIRNLFQELAIQAMRAEGTKKVAGLPENKIKNRYSNVHPYDHSRVVLQFPDGEGSGDYINACYVNGYAKQKEYIASQGPKDNTIGDFWWMVWQEQSTMIAMLNKLKENGRSKCAKYWPEAGGTKTYGSITVTAGEEAECPAGDILKRVFTITAEGQSAAPREVVQYQFTGWPDFGIPSTADGLLDILDVVSKETSEGSGPLVVHCSAGIGRTGTFCTIDTSLKMLEDKRRIDILGAVTSLRSQRSGMVQTKEQLDFCFQALMEVVEAETMEAAQSLV